MVDTSINMISHQKNNMWQEKNSHRVQQKNLCIKYRDNAFNRSNDQTQSNYFKHSSIGKSKTAEMLVRNASNISQRLRREQDESSIFDSAWATLKGETWQNYADIINE